MRDVGEALKTLDNILLFFAGVIVFFISLSVFDVNLGDSLTSVYSLFIAASFFFKNAASSAFNSIMFLFVTQWVLRTIFYNNHALIVSSPYDTGDRVFIDRKISNVQNFGHFIHLEIS